jgi:hypothetical protein
MRAVITPVTDHGITLHQQLESRDLKKIVAIWVLIAVLLQTFSAAIIVSDYLANKKFISEKLCENRSRPQLHCNGKCYLKKKIARESGEQNGERRNRAAEDVVVLFFEKHEFEIYYDSDVAPASSIFRNRDVLLTIDVARSVFRPPSLLV